MNTRSFREQPFFLKSHHYKQSSQLIPNLECKKEDSIVLSHSCLSNKLGSSALCLMLFYHNYLIWNSRIQIAKDIT